jgi:hypothetical protein
MSLAITSLSSGGKAYLILGSANSLGIYIVCGAYRYHLPRPEGKQEAEPREEEDAAIVVERIEYRY